MNLSQQLIVSPLEQYEDKRLLNQPSKEPAKLAEEQEQAAKTEQNGGITSSERAKEEDEQQEVGWRASVLLAVADRT